MYVGRIVAAGLTPGGQPVVAYRVSSRSFPNRDAARVGNTVWIVPRAGSADAASDSPYIAYEALVWDGRWAVASNGTHTRPVHERLRAGHAPRDAMLGVLAGLDREFDAQDTPRILGVADLREGRLWLGAVTAEALCVTPVEPRAGQLAYVATYEIPLPSPDRLDRAFGAGDAAGTCAHLVHGTTFARYAHPVCAAAAVGTAAGFAVAVLDVASGQDTQERTP